MALLDASEPGHDLPGGAVAALETFVFDESLLYGLQFAAAGDPFDGGDGGALMHHRKRKTGVDPLVVDEHGAGAASPLVASLLGARQSQPLAQHVEHR
ncbi:hypothetical protein D3C71_2022030 [compost metagenome]